MILNEPIAPKKKLKKPNVSLHSSKVYTDTDHYFKAWKDFKNRFKRRGIKVQ